MGISIICVAPMFAEELKFVLLPKPQIDGGRPLMQVLKDRSSSRSFSPEKLSSQSLSNLLWAAFGINRPDTGKRTAPSAMDRQEIDVYVATAELTARSEDHPGAISRISQKITMASGNQLMSLTEY
jgi:hypothetical protein